MDKSSKEPRALSPEEGERYVQLLARYQKRILGYIYSLVPHAQNAEDICQKTSLILWRKFYQFEADGDFLAWACRVAYLEACNFRRTAARDRLYFSDELIAFLAEDRQRDLAHTNRRIEALLHCVKRLGSPQQELLNQAYSNEQTIRQLAERLGQATQTIYNRLFRIRRLLFDCVQRQLIAEAQS